MQEGAMIMRYALSRKRMRTLSQKFMVIPGALLLLGCAHVQSIVAGRRSGTR